MARWQFFSIRLVLPALLVLLLPGSPGFPRGKTRGLSPEILKENPDVARMMERVAEDPGNAALRTQLANLYAGKGWNDLAIEAYSQALQSDQTYYVAWANQGTVYTRLGNLHAAERALRNAINLQPRAALAHYNLGVVLDRESRYDEALAAYKTAVTYQPELLDPKVNPQVVNNTHLTTVRLMNYLDSVGSSTLPLLPPGDAPLLTSGGLALLAPPGEHDATGEAQPAADTGAPAAPPDAAPAAAVPPISWSPPPEGSTPPASAGPAEDTAKPLLGKLVVRKPGRSKVRPREDAADETGADSGSDDR